VILYIWVWLPGSDIPPRFYPRIVTRVAGGVVVMAIVFGLRMLHPGVTVDFAFGTQAVLLAIGTIAGLWAQGTKPRPSFRPNYSRRKTTS